MINYPNGRTYNPTSKRQYKKDKIEISISSSNRGMNLEKDINLSNDYYKNNGLALIYKRPTPINVVKVNYNHGCKITNAYFEKQSTTDYNGIYKSRYIDFEAKSTKSKTSFPLHNISKHQLDHLEKVIYHGGIAFFIVYFETLDEVYLLDAKFVLDYVNKKQRKSIPYHEFKNSGHIIKTGYKPRIDYLPVIDAIYLNS